MPTVSFRGKQVTDRDVLRIPPDRSLEMLGRGR